MINNNFIMKLAKDYFITILPFIVIGLILFFLIRKIKNKFHNR